jgi:glycosyltransferase involved in cell wall biosynthesis
MPAEVIVVDNNSTDRTAEIASSYSFVRVINEKRQGVSFANEAGFAAASSELIGRIDADTTLSADWIKVATDFLDINQGVAAITGKCYFYDFPYRRVASALHASIYHHLQSYIAGTDILWASNMVIRKRAWEAVRADCHNGNGINEDIDISLQLKRQGLKIRRITKLTVGVSLRRGDLSPLSIVKYLSGWPRNYWANRMWIRGSMISLIIVLIFFLTMPLSVAYFLINSHHPPR